MVRFAKTTRPSASASVKRPRLFRRLERARARPITWVWGPPGAGKTALVATYLAAKHLGGIWYQVDLGDGADIATFFYYLGQAAPRRRRPMPLFTPEYRRGLAVFARRFFRELFSRLKTPFALVFDNYHEISSDSVLHDVLRDAAAELPKSGRMILISRSEPPAPFARLRSTRAIEMLGWDQLRFTRSETDALARRLAAKRWSRKLVDRIHKSTDGWAAGLVLSLEERREESQADFPSPVQSSPVIFDYFAAEIFKKAAPKVQEVLLQTAFLPRTTARMAEELTGVAGAGEFLADLERQNYFINKRSGDEPTYEFHPLFREFLLAQAKRTYARRRGEIQLKAAALAERMGQLDNAAALLRDLEDWGLLAGLIRRHAAQLLAQGRIQTLENWLKSIPNSVLGQDPWLLYSRALTRLGWRNDDARLDCERALALFRAGRDTAGMFLAWAAAVFSYIYGSDSAPLDSWIALLDELVREAPRFPSEEVETWVAAGMLAAVVWRQPQHSKGAFWAERAWELAKRHPDPALQTGTAISFFLYHLLDGDPTKAAAAADEMRRLLSSRDVLPTVALNAAVTAVWHDWICASPSHRQTVLEMLELARASGAHHSATYAVLCGGIFGALSNGDLATAHQWLGALEKDLKSLGPGYHFWHRFLALREALGRGEVERAAGYRAEMLRLGIADGWPLDEALGYLLSAEVFHQLKRPKEALFHLRRALGIARRLQSPYVDFMCQLARARIDLDGEREAEGIAALARGMAVGKACGFVNSQMWTPSIMANLCAKALEAGIEVEYVQHLIRKRALVPQTPPVEIEAWPRPIKVYTLGRFAVLKDGELLRFSGKAQRRPLALLKAIIAFGGRNVREDALMDALWPEAEGPAARFALNSAIYRLRRLLGYENAIARQQGEVSLDNRHCWVDLWAVERLLGRTEAAGLKDERPTDEAIRSVEKAARLYQGSFLQNDPDFSGAATVADRLRRRLLQQLVRIAQHWERSDRWQDAANSYEEASRVDPCAEDVCRRLMSAYQRLGRPADVIATYRHCRDALAAQLGAAPSAETEALLKRLRV
ncbi:MAG TPA: BTAD domain-containing putative transcriptional regulator [Candidatus Binatia bacterium]|nr:BTAD domain-containing putative transcriptional regulator [Candidatus Binatia bacterium]